MKALVLLFAIACGGGSAKPPPAPTSPTPPPPDAAVATTPDAPVPDPAKVKADLLAAEHAAYEKARPVFEKWCASCHSRDGKKTSAKKREHFDMTKYPFGGHHAMEISGEIREALGLTGKAPTMPADKKGAVKGDELAAIAAWADAFDASHEGGAHEGHGSGHSH